MASKQTWKQNKQTKHMHTKIWSSGVTHSPSRLNETGAFTCEFL